ncbi:MAG: hypothetical protein ACK4S2_03305 [Gemmobacter sp.]|uniref:hypothetical protein n=1 Tax=Gemmobacter sp. TaxID=1898957 RepID=UPI00391A3B6E
MTARVTYLCPRERIWLDPSRIGLLYAELGGAEVQALLDRAMQELAVVHDGLRAQYAARDLDGFARSLRRLRRIAEHLGLTTVGRIAADVGECLDRGDPTALAATWARLSRSAEQAQMGNWNSA